MKVLITGGAGFIGTNFVHYYVSKYPEQEVVVLDKLTYCGNYQNLENLESLQNFKFIKGDIADKQFIDNLFKQEQFDLVINFAAETHVDRSITGPEAFITTNIIGTHNLLIAAKENRNIRFHQVSTDEVYGDLGNTQNTYFNEETPYDPSSPYSASKASADMLCRAYFRTYNLPITISTCSNNYGPYQYPEKLIPFFYDLVQNGKKVTLYGDGKNIRDWLYVEDHCTAIDYIIKKGKHGQTYCIGGNNEIENIDIAEQILAYFNKDKSEIEFVEDRAGHDRRYAIDSSKIKNDLGWEPKIEFKEGIKNTLKWYDKNREWLNSIKKCEN